MARRSKCEERLRWTTTDWAREERKEKEKKQRRRRQQSEAVELHETGKVTLCARTPELPVITVLLLFVNKRKWPLMGCPSLVRRAGGHDERAKGALSVSQLRQTRMILESRSWRLMGGRGTAPRFVAILRPWRELKI